MTKIIFQNAFVAAMFLLVFSCSADAQKKRSATNVSSVYTDLKNDCKFVEDKTGDAQGSDSPRVCKGFGDYKISIGYSAWAASVAVESNKDSSDTIVLGTDYGNYGEKGEKVEWRIANGKPFAVIIRFGKYGAENGDGDPFANRTGSFLVVKGLKGFEQVDFKIDGATPNANQKAREMADANYAKSK